MGAKSRTKGNRAENEAIRFLRDRLGAEYERHTAPAEGYMARQNGIDLTPLEGHEALPCIQVKDYAGFNLFRWLSDPQKEAGRHKGELAASVAWMVKAPRQGWLLIGSAGDLKTLVAGNHCSAWCDPGLGLTVVCFGF